MFHAQQALQRNRGLPIRQSLGRYSAQLIAQTESFSETSRLCKSPLSITFVQFCGDGCGELNTTVIPGLGKAIARADTFQSLISLRAWDHVLPFSPLSLLSLHFGERSQGNDDYVLSLNDATAFSSRLLSATTDVDADSLIVFIVPPINYSTERNSRLLFRCADQTKQPVFSPSNRALVLAMDNVHESTEQARHFVANETLKWLLGDGTDRIAVLSELNADRIKVTLSRECLVQAAKSVQTSLNVLSAVHDNMSSSQFSDALQSAIVIIEETAKLISSIDSQTGTAEDQATVWQASRRAWEAARAVSSHKDLSLLPHLPVEHAFALLLPLGMPVTLAILQSLVATGKLFLRRPPDDKLKTE